MTNDTTLTAERLSAQATTQDHLRNMLTLMKRGARLNLTDIPNDPTFLSSNISGNTAKEIAAHIELALQAKGVGMKPLEWEETPFLWKAATALGFYTIRTVEGSPDPFEVCTPDDYLCMKASLDEAKAAAEADYRQRILACLQPPVVVSDDLRARIKKAIMLEVQLHDLAHEDEDGSVTVTNSQIDLLDVVCDKAADRVLAALSPTSKETK